MLRSRFPQIIASLEPRAKAAEQAVAEVVAVSEPLPDVVEQAIASRSGRGNVNRASQLRASARLLLKETQGNAAEVADLILTGSGDLDL